MQRLGVPSIQRLLFTSSKNEDGSEKMKVAGKPGNFLSKFWFNPAPLSRGVMNVFKTLQREFIERF